MNGDARIYRGEAVYMFAFDVAYEMGRGPILQLLGQKVEQFKVEAGKRSPRHPFFFRPQMVRLPVSKVEGPEGTTEVRRVIKILPIGAISITVTIPFQVDRLEKLVEFHDVALGPRTLHDEVRELAEKVYAELRPHVLRPAEYLPDEEAYTVFCLDSSAVLGAGEKAEEWLQEHRRRVAGVLTQEPDLTKLSEQEAIESTGRYLSYYENDLTVIDWDAALVLDDPEDFAETLYVMELANLHLAELEAYDRMLDRALERSYRDLRERSFRKKRDVLIQLREIRIDLARYSDELSNITKFIGDWHLARVYETISSRFHLGDWHRSVNEKLRTLDNLYQMLQHDQSNRWMLMLEAMIVVLFILDLIMIFTSGH